MLVLSTAAVMGAAVLLSPPVLANPEPQPSEESFPEIPLPPPIEGLLGLPQTYGKPRSTYLALITREAEQQGLPPALADAVAKVESSYNPNAVGGVGEVGLMQIRPQTAAMLGYGGGVTGLFDPETNVRLGVAYLARAWDLAKGDVCGALMKYRAGWGEERMTPLSVEYCRRARGHLAAIGSPLAKGALPESTGLETPFAAVRAPTASSGATAQSAPPLRLAPTGMAAKGHVTAHRVPPLRPAPDRLASTRLVKGPSAQAKALMWVRAQERLRVAKRRQMWAEHDSRMDAVMAKLKPSQLQIAAGL